MADFKISMLRTAVLGYVKIFLHLVFQLILQHSSEQEEMRIFPGPLTKYVQWVLRACFSWHFGSFWVLMNASDVGDVVAWQFPVNLLEKCEKHCILVVFGNPPPPSCSKFQLSPNKSSFLAAPISGSQVPDFKRKTSEN